MFWLVVASCFPGAAWPVGSCWSYGEAVEDGGHHSRGPGSGHGADDDVAGVGERRGGVAGGERGRGRHRDLAGRRPGLAGRPASAGSSCDLGGVRSALGGWSVWAGTTPRLPGPTTPPSPPPSRPAACRSSNARATTPWSRSPSASPPWWRPSAPPSPGSQSYIQRDLRLHHNGPPGASLALGLEVRRRMSAGRFAAAPGPGSPCGPAGPARAGPRPARCRAS